MATNLTELDKPIGSPQEANEPVIHAIPREFYGAAVPVRHSLEAAAVAPVTPPAAPKKGNGLIIAVIIALVVLLVAAAGASYYFLFREKPVVTPPPAAPVCGDYVCDATESFDNCSADCAKPAPVCGDSACEGTETYATCSADCPKPPPVCGDYTCDATETYALCPSDCQPPAPVCGDGQCESGKEDTNSCPGDCRPPEPVAGQDLDSDGLTDLEETQVYDTDTRNADTDADSFVDLNELVNLYNPARPLPSKLKDNPGITIHENDLQKYSVYRPTSWSVRENDDVMSEVYFTAPDGESIEVLVQPKPEASTLLDWYLSQAPGVKANEVTVTKTRQGHEALQTPDKLTSYINVGNRVIALVYQLGEDRLMQYRATFLMMMQSLKAEPVKEVMVPAVKVPVVETPADETPAAPPATVAAPAP